MYLENRIIAMLDVLGLSKRLNTKEDLINTSKIYNDLITTTKTEILSTLNLLAPDKPPKSNFEVGEFVFDNLVLVSHPLKTNGSASSFMHALTAIMQKFALHDMPLRGAMGIGDYCADPRTNVFLSNIFKDLNREESNQNWTGCIVLEDAREEILDILIGSLKNFTPNQSDVLIRMPVPFKENLIAERWCLNWMSTLSPKKTKHILSYLEGNQEKLEGTKTHLDFLSRLPDDVQILPPECEPAVNLRIIKTREGFQVLFTDSAGEPADPGCDVNLNIVQNRADIN